MSTVHRFEVRPLAHASDPDADALMRDAERLGLDLRAVRTARIYLIQADLDAEQQQRLLSGLLVDPVIETGSIGATPPRDNCSLIEIHPLPGVMDPAAQSVAEAVRTLLGVEARVSTGRRFELEGNDPGGAETLARRVLANPVIHAVHTSPFHPERLPEGTESNCPLRHIAIRDLDDEALERLSREAHLFLSLDEMRAIRDEYRSLERDPTDIELETLAQTWSEHCVHKTLKSTIRYREEAAGREDDGINTAGSSRRVEDETIALCWSARPGHEVHDDGSVTIHNLLKSTVAAATNELIAEGVDWTLSVFVDNAGVVAFDDEHAVCVKVETHNHPSAIEPYGGAATGIGGCIRDIIGTGLAAKPIASTDVFCVGTPHLDEVPTGCLHPRRILTDVVAGVRDYGNRMGIPTLNGAVWFDDRYVGNPLVFCGCIGIMPRDLIEGKAQAGDLIVVLGGRTGRDGIHGATFSSAELTDTHADEFAHAVQIGNAIEEKRVLDAILRARDWHPDEPAGNATGKLRHNRPLFHAITDCGAGGFSSAVGEMGEHLGAEVHLDRAPLKYAGLTYTEIWISEAQERMVLAVPEQNLSALQRICDEEHVELCVLGTFGTPNRELVLNYRGVEVGRLSMEFLHEGIPTPTRQAVWRPRHRASACTEGKAPFISVRDTLLALLSHPNIASKHFIIRQYDHEVQGNTVIRPLGGPAGRGPMDAAVIEPVPGTGRGLAVGCGLAIGFEADPYQMALAAIDECVRNLVCVGADPDRIAILDNFCWPSCARPENLAGLVRAAEGCYDGAKAYRTPFVSGKDSLNNQFTTDDGRTIEIPPTLLISGIGIVEDIARCVTMDAKQPGNTLIHLETRCAGPANNATWACLGNSHFARIFALPETAEANMPRWNPHAGAKLARVVAQLIRSGAVVSAHDVSDGGLLCAIAEMLIAGSSTDGSIGCRLPWNHHADGLFGLGYWFGERPTGFVLECTNPDSVLDLVAHELRDEVEAHTLATLDDSGRIEINAENLRVVELADAWRSTLDW